MRIKIAGHDLAVKNLDTARIRSVAELQQQTGWKLPEIRTLVAENESYSAAVVTFLSMRDGGVSTTWDDVLDTNFNEVQVIAEPGDVRIAQEAPADPQSPSGASAPDDAPQPAEPPTEG
ncbi:hypothetical protein [uncultured Microbacterium sp.]|uniref:hypothetical protein n=1 Tax=uncultured Microbacterium sp. TaxID=191216 RepID=UPI0025FF6F00|nr:hypothetical protein [uncultured Microbacterium sp.]